MDLSSASDVRATTPGPTLSRTEQGSSTTQANKNPATEGASTPAPFILSSSWFSPNRHTPRYLLPVEKIEKFGYRDALALGQ